MPASDFTNAKKKTLIIGASSRPDRYAYLAAEMLRQYGHEFVPVGIHPGQVLGLPILPLSELPPVAGLDTITLYIGTANQRPWFGYILGLKPRRLIFNPGTENPELEQQAQQAGIETLQACTLVMLRTGQY
jgi:predicted CoA-binding protein